MGRRKSSLIGRRGLAEALGVNPRTIDKWRDDGMPVAQRGSPGKEARFSRADVDAWRGAKQAANGNGSLLSLEAERAKLARVQTEKADLDVRLRKGDLVSREDTLQAWASIVVAVRAKLLAIPRALAAQLASVTDAATIEAALRIAMHEALAELATRKGAKTVRRKRNTT